VLIAGIGRAGGIGHQALLRERDDSLGPPLAVQGLARAICRDARTISSRFAISHHAKPIGRSLEPLASGRMLPKSAP
jgi:hypothetical protein